MGHAHHFLSRLDRLSLSHVELALALYRDDERLRYVLEQARVPEGAERVAISLEDPHEGPFVLVTRTGRFVTCLARGMRVGDLPVIPRAHLDAISAKRVLWQEREAAREQVAAQQGGISALLRRLLDAGPFLAREEFAALAALHPLVGDRYFEMAIEWGLTSRRIQHNLRTALKKRGARLWPLQIEQLHMYWKTFFAAGHLAVLSVVDGGEMLQQRAGGDAAAFDRHVGRLTAIAIDGGIVSRTTRGMWPLAELGKLSLPYAKRRLLTAATAADVLAAGLALLAIAVRHEDLRSEVIGVFEAPPDLPAGEARTWVDWLCPGAVKILHDVEGSLADHRKLGAALAFDAHELYPEHSPYRYARVEDVPADIAFGHPYHLILHLAREPGTLPHAISMIVAAASAAPEQLYLPRRCVEVLEPKWTPDLSLLIMEGWLEQARNPAPRPTGPTRSGPCPCGSGKKYKRCCGAEETA